MDNRIEIALKGNEFKRVLEYYFETVKKQYNLKKVDMEVLLYLSKCGEKNTPTDVYKYLGLNRGHVSQAIDDLIEKCYIKPVADPEDRRITHYLVTNDALEVIKKIALLKEDFDKKLFEGISEEELKEYKRITLKIIENMDNMEKM
ncbi:MAG: MarR family winged helix-turn-helix transcriptional regulator, partial [Lachnospiraceae bacterium]|nr:MarR family winged helix-turn-helix transcriptional regulator [Lachnospiraceae bacterium]